MRYTPRNTQVFALVRRADSAAKQTKNHCRGLLAELAKQVCWYAKLFDEDTRAMLEANKEIRSLRIKLKALSGITPYPKCPECERDGSALASKTAEVEALKEKVRVMRKVVDCAIEVFAHDEDWAGTAIPNLGYAVSEYKALSTGVGKGA